MAQGQTTRNNLSMRNPDDVPGALREVKRWADRLPLGSAGFHVYQSAAIPQVLIAGNVIPINFDKTNGDGTTALDRSPRLDRERWKPSGTVSSLTVPAGLSGVYLLSGGIYLDLGVTHMIAAIRVNGLAVTSSEYDGGGAASGTLDRMFPSVGWPLYERDVLELVCFNGSGGNRNTLPTTFTVLGPRGPFLSAWRISLL